MICDSPNHWDSPSARRERKLCDIIIGGGKLKEGEYLREGSQSALEVEARTVLIRNI